MTTTLAKYDIDSVYDYLADLSQHMAKESDTLITVLIRDDASKSNRFLSTDGNCIGPSLVLALLQVLPDDINDKDILNMINVARGFRPDIGDSTSDRVLKYIEKTHKEIK